MSSGVIDPFDPYDVYRKISSHLSNVISYISEYMNSNEFIEHLNRISKSIKNDFRDGIERYFGVEDVDVDVSVGYIDVYRHKYPSLIVRIKPDIYRGREIRCIDRYRLVMALESSIYFKVDEYGIVIDNLHSRLERDQDSLIVKLCVVPHPMWIINKLI